jgi:2-keto-4-pentenoate hydratase/2-oxohepta-3-ene-1,7-dioic acid hydratase in catechol pathway
MPRYVRFQRSGKPQWGELTDAGLVPLMESPYADSTARGSEILAQGTYRLLAPVEPSKIICVGRNYRDHAAELNNPVPAEPLLFMKPPSAVIGPEEVIRYPSGLSELVHHEGELAVVIGKRAFDIDTTDVHRYILGYTLLNDVTARDIQRRDEKFTRAKGFDTFAPIGPYIDTDFAPAAQTIRVHVNGQLRQEGQLSQMIFSVDVLVSTISQVMTLEPGDVVSTGTPAGVGALEPGDSVEVSLDGLGVLRNKVAAR